MADSVFRLLPLAAQFPFPARTPTLATDPDSGVFPLDLSTYQVVTCAVKHAVYAQPVRL